MNGMENISSVFQRQKRKKKRMERLSFITQFKIEFLPPFTDCRKVLGKMTGRAILFQTSQTPPLHIFEKLGSNARKKLDLDFFLVVL